MLTVVIQLVTIPILRRHDVPLHFTVSKQFFTNVLREALEFEVLAGALIIQTEWLKLLSGDRCCLL